MEAQNVEREGSTQDTTKTLEVPPGLEAAESGKESLEPLELPQESNVKSTGRQNEIRGARAQTTTSTQRGRRQGARSQAGAVAEPRNTRARARQSLGQDPSQANTPPADLRISNESRTDQIDKKSSVQVEL